MTEASDVDSPLPTAEYDVPGAGRTVTAAHERVRFLDCLRGVALCGIFPVNIVYFGLATEAADAYGLVLPPADRIAHELTEAFFTFRFVTLFSFLFGVGIFLLGRKCARDGIPARRMFVQRFAALLLFGIAHVVFLWYGDILVYYAALGFLVAVGGISRLTPRTQVILGSGAFVLPVVFLLGMAAIAAAFPDPILEQMTKEHGDPALARAAALGDEETFLREIWDFNPAFETAVYAEGSYARQVVVRLCTYLIVFLVTLFLLVPRAFALFCFGIASAQHGWILDPVRHRASFRRALVWGLGAGLPLQGLATWLWLAQPNGAGILIGVTLQYLASLGTSAFYLGAVGLLCARPSPPRFLLPFEALGRMAFTQYILQSVLAAGFFYSWGFGQFGKLGFAELWWVVLCVWAFGLTTSTLWLKKFRHGPLEALWRRLTYLGIRAQPVAQPVAPGERPKS